MLLKCHYYTLFCSEKVIMLLSGGTSSDTLSAISSTIADGRRLAGKVKILTFGVNTHGTVIFV